MDPGELWNVVLVVALSMTGYAIYGVYGCSPTTQTSKKSFLKKPGNFREN